MLGCDATLECSARFAQYTVHLQLEELEGTLFRGTAASLKNFGREEEEHAARLPSNFDQVAASTL